VQAVNDYNTQERGMLAMWKAKWDTKETERMAQAQATVAEGEANMPVIDNERKA
jgi:hypothetical protein